MRFSARRCWSNFARRRARRGRGPSSSPWKMNRRPEMTTAAARILVSETRAKFPTLWVRAMRLALLRALCDAAACCWLKRPLLLSADAARRVLPADHVRTESACSPPLTPPPTYRLIRRRTGRRSALASQPPPPSPSLSAAASSALAAAGWRRWKPRPRATSRRWTTTQRGRGAGGEDGLLLAPKRRDRRRRRRRRARDEDGAVGPTKTSSSSAVVILRDLLHLRGGAGLLLRLRLLLRASALRGARSALAAALRPRAPSPRVPPRPRHAPPGPGELVRLLRPRRGLLLARLFEHQPFGVCALLLAPGLGLGGELRAPFLAPWPPTSALAARSRSACAASSRRRLRLSPAPWRPPWPA